MPEQDPAAQPESGVSFTIRHATPEDREVLMGLFSAGVDEGAFILTENEPRDSDLVEGQGTDSAVAGCWIAEETTRAVDNQSRIIGMIGLNPLEDHMAEARRLFVVPERRGIGVGAALLEQLVETCREAGYLKIILDVGERSETAVRLLNRLGFQLARERESDGRVLLDFYLDIYRDNPG